MNNTNSHEIPSFKLSDGELFSIYDHREDDTISTMDYVRAQADGDNLMISINLAAINGLKKSMEHVAKSSAYSPFMIDYINTQHVAKIEQYANEIMQLKTTRVTAEDIK